MTTAYMMTPEDIDTAVRAAWQRDKTLDQSWHSPTVYVGPWVRAAYIAGREEIENERPHVLEPDAEVRDVIDYLRAQGVDNYADIVLAEHKARREYGRR